MHRHYWNTYICWALLAVSMVTAGRAEESKTPTLEELVKESGPAFTIRVVDDAGRPIEGALAGSYGLYRNGRWQNGLLEPKFADANGDIHFDYGRSDLTDFFFAIHEGRRLAGFAAVAGGGEGPAWQVRVLPARLVRGKLICSKLPDADVPSSCDARIFLGKTPVLEYAGRDAKYEFLLPPGDYEIEVSGHYIYNLRRPLRVESGAGDVEIPAIDVTPSQLALLKGKPAPELRGVAAWKNSPRLRLADLKGRYVLLDFWGHWCGACVERMPKLMAVRDRCPEDKLAIVGVHVGLEGDDEVDTVEKFDAALVDVRKNDWGGRDLPFPVALVKAEKTSYPEVIGNTNKKANDELGVTCARSQAAADFGVVGYPTIILIDRDGRVVGNAREFVESEEGVAKLAKLIGAE